MHVFDEGGTALASLEPDPTYPGPAGRISFLFLCLSRPELLEPGQSGWLADSTLPGSDVEMWLCFALFSLMRRDCTCTAATRGISFPKAEYDYHFGTGLTALGRHTVVT